MAVQPSKTGKYVRFTVDVWFQESDQQIHMSSPDFNFHTTVNDNPDSKRRHGNLFKHLQGLLKTHDRWPDPGASG